MIRLAQPSEFAVLSALALRSKAHWGYDESFMRACVPELEIKPGPGDLIYALESEGGLLGFHGIERLDEKICELGYLFVEPSEIGRGHGRALIEHAKAEAAKLGYERMIIQGDPNATRFYKAAGAVQIGFRPSASIPGRDLPLFEIALPTVIRAP